MSLKYIVNIMFPISFQKIGGGVYIQTPLVLIVPVKNYLYENIAQW